MKDLLPYISAIVAFLAALIAVVGKPKWDASNRGVRRLTGTGRFVVALAGLALASTIALTWSAQRSAEEQRTQRGEIRKLAHTELRLAIQELSEQFVGVLVMARRTVLRDPGEPSPRTSGKPFPFCMLDATDYALIVAKTDPVLSEPSQQPSTKDLLADPELLRRHNSDARRYTTRSQIKRDAASASAAIDRTLQTYAAYLEPGVLYAVSELRRSRWLWQLQNLGPQMPVDFGLIDGRFRRDDDLGYQRFWTLIEKLWNEEDGLFRDSTNKELWGPDHFLMKQLRGDDPVGSGPPK